MDQSNPISRGSVSKGFIPDSGHTLSESFADYHSDVNGDVFEHWFEKKLLPNLQEKCTKVLDNASYHSRQTDDEHSEGRYTKIHER